MLQPKMQFQLSPIAYVHALCFLFLAATLAGCATTAVHPRLTFDPAIGGQLIQGSDDVSLYLNPVYKSIVGRKMIQNESDLIVPTNVYFGEALELFTREYVDRSFDKVYLLDQPPKPGDRYLSKYVLIPVVKHFNLWDQPILSLRRHAVVELELLAYDGGMNPVFTAQSRHQENMALGFFAFDDGSDLVGRAVQHCLSDLLNRFHRHINTVQ